VTTAVLRPLAEADLIARTRHVRTHGGNAVAERFFDAAIAALVAIEKMPRAGSPRLGELCGIPGLRTRRVIGVSCCWYYLVAGKHVDVVRLLDDAQDLPTILADLTGD